MKTKHEQRLTLEATLRQTALLFQEISSPHREGVEWCKLGPSRSAVDGHFEVRRKAQYETAAGMVSVESMLEESDQPITEGTARRRAFTAHATLDLPSGRSLKIEWNSTLSMPYNGPEHISEKTTHFFLRDGSVWRKLNPSQLAHIAYAHGLDDAFASICLDMRHEDGQCDDAAVLECSTTTNKD